MLKAPRQDRAHRTGRTGQGAQDRAHRTGRTVRIVMGIWVIEVRVNEFVGLLFENVMYVVTLGLNVVVSKCFMWVDNGTYNER